MQEKLTFQDALKKYGDKMTQEKIRDNKGRFVKGHSFSEETKRKISETLKGKDFKPDSSLWFQKGHNTWNKGKHFICEGSFKKGHFVPQKWREIISKNFKGKSSHRKGILLSEETKQKIRLARLNQIIPTKDTLPERIIQNKLKELEIEFETHKSIIGQPDIFIEPNICIFVDGCYWHACQQCFSDRNKWTNVQRKAIVKDVLVTQKLINEDYLILRFWEHEINNSIEMVIKSIKEIIWKKEIMLMH